MLCLSAEGCFDIDVYCPRVSGRGEEVTETSLKASWERGYIVYEAGDLMVFAYRGPDNQQYQSNQTASVLYLLPQWSLKCACSVLEATRVPRFTSSL